jgi:OOP family OmpA-OmpF porin
MGPTPDAGAQGFRDMPRGPSATAVAPVQGPGQTPLPVTAPVLAPGSGQGANANPAAVPGPSPPSHSAVAASSNAKEPTAKMTADEIVKALLASPAERARSAQGAQATAGGAQGAQGAQAANGQKVTPAAPDPADGVELGWIDLQIQFEFNSAVILEESHPLLDQVAVALNSARLKARRFDVEGHTDGVGSKANNDILSARRAQAVVGYLKAAGVAPERMRPVGKGFSELLYPFEPKAAANRRVRIRFQSL